MKILCMLSNNTQAYLNYKSFSLNRGKTIFCVETICPSFFGSIFECRNEFLKSKEFFEGEYRYNIIPYLNELGDCDKSLLLKLRFRASISDNLLQFNVFPELSKDSIFECQPTFYNWGKKESEAIIVLRGKEDL